MPPPNTRTSAVSKRRFREAMYEKRLREKQQQEEYEHSQGVLLARQSNVGDVVSVYDWEQVWDDSNCETDETFKVVLDGREYEDYDAFLADFQDKIPNKWLVVDYTDHTHADNGMGPRRESFRTITLQTLDPDDKYKRNKIHIYGVRDSNVRPVSEYFLRPATNSMGAMDMATRMERLEMGERPYTSHMAMGTMGAADRRRQQKQQFINRIHYYLIIFELQTSSGTKFDVRIRKQGEELRRARHVGVKLDDRADKTFVTRVKPGSLFDEALQRTGHAGDGPFEIVHLGIDGMRYFPVAHGGRSNKNEMLAALRGVAQLEWGQHLYPGSHMSTPTMGRSTCGTGAVAGQALKLKAAAKAKALEAKRALGDRYWKAAADDVGSNLASQHANWVDEHRAHVQQWAAAINNIVKDLKSAKAKAAKMKALPDDEKKEKKVEQADNAVDKAKDRLDKWLDEHDSQPYEKVAQMYAKFELGGLEASKRIEKLDKAVHRARDDLKAKYEKRRTSAIADAQKIIVVAVKAAIAEGWEAEGLANRKAYE